MQRLGIVGHRVLDRKASEFVSSACSALIADAQRTTTVAAVSALAEGADTLFAEAAVSAGATLEIVQPYDGYEGEFDPGPRCRYREAPPCGTPGDTAAVRPAFDAGLRGGDAPRHGRVRCSCGGVGRDAAARDGRTADTVRYAERIGRRIVHLDVVGHRVIVRGPTG